MRNAKLEWAPNGPDTQAAMQLAQQAPAPKQQQRMPLLIIGIHSDRSVKKCAPSHVTRAAHEQAFSNRQSSCCCQQHTTC